MSEFDNPVTGVIRKYGFRTCTAAVAAVVQQKTGIVILLFFQHFKRNLLNPVEIGQGLFLFEDEGRGVGECAHTVVANNSEPVQ